MLPAIICLWASNGTQRSHMLLCVDRQITCMFSIGTPVLLWCLFITSNKAVADGAVSFYIDHLVTTRAAKLTYGLTCLTPFQSGRVDHVSRTNTKLRDLAGSWVLPNAFQSILKKVLPSSDCSTKPDILQGTQVSERQEFRSSFFMLRKSATDCTSISDKIIAYRGSLSDPCWMDIETGNISL